MPNMNLLTLSMIVRDEEELLPICLKSIREFVDEIVIVDTGSNDSTVDVARSFGARVEHFEWINDFSAARNYALSLVRTPWVLWLDADDLVLNPEGIRQGCDTAHKDRVSGLWSKYYQDSACYQRRLSIFKRKDFRWQGAIHESPQAPRAGTKTAYTDLEILHRKPASRCLESAKRYLEIIQEKEPENWMGLAESYKLLAIHEKKDEHFLTAYDYYIKAAGHPGTNQGTIYAALFQASQLMLDCAFRKIHPDAVVACLKAANAGIALAPERAECHVIAGQVYHALGRWEDARKEYEAALACKPQDDYIGLIFPAYYEKMPRQLLDKLKTQAENPPLLTG